MKGLNIVRKLAGTSLAFLVLLVAQSASTNTCFIFHQDEIPEKVKALKKEK